jgi:hypothetical protein
MAELMTNPKGAEILGKMTQGNKPDKADMDAMLNDEGDTRETAYDSEALSADMPLAKLADFSGGALTRERLSGLLAIINS